MPDILHRISIDTPTERVHELIVTTDGIARWWTGRPLNYLTSLKAGAESGQFAAYPHGEISRWS